MGAGTGPTQPGQAHPCQPEGQRVDKSYDYIKTEISRRSQQGRQDQPLLARQQQLHARLLKEKQLHLPGSTAGRCWNSALSDEICA